MIEYEPKDKPEPCRVCGELKRRSAMLAHAHKKHPIQFFNWHSARGDFGMSAFDHFSLGNMEKADIRT